MAERRSDRIWVITADWDAPVLWEAESTKRENEVENWAGGGCWS